MGWDLGWDLKGEISCAIGIVKRLADAPQQGSISGEVGEFPNITTAAMTTDWPVLQNSYTIVL